MNPLRSLPDTHQVTITDRSGSQEPIPWCTTHDRQADPETLEYEAKYCFEAGSDEQPCMISTVGLDHKWWKDVE